MQRLEVSCAVRHIYIYMSLGAKRLIETTFFENILACMTVRCLRCTGEKRRRESTRQSF